MSLVRKNNIDDDCQMTKRRTTEECAFSFEI